MSPCTLRLGDALVPSSCYAQYCTDLGHGTGTGISSGTGLGYRASLCHRVLVGWRVLGEGPGAVRAYEAARRCGGKEPSDRVDSGELLPTQPTVLLIDDLGLPITRDSIFRARDVEGAASVEEGNAYSGTRVTVEVERVEDPEKPLGGQVDAERCPAGVISGPASIDARADGS
eukprot:2043426-Rhodomonas_salina.1